MNLTNSSTFEDTTIRNEQFMYSYSIWCSEFLQSTDKFASALQVYRSVQLEDAEYTAKNLSIAGKLEETIPPMNASDAVRAAIALAMVNRKSCPGETFEFTECGVYHWKFIAPLLILFGLLVIYAVSNGLMVMNEQANIDLPHSSSAWSAAALEYKMQSEGMSMKLQTGEGRDREYGDARTLPRGVYRLVENENGNQEVVLTFDFNEGMSEGERKATEKVGR